MNCIASVPGAVPGRVPRRPPAHMQCLAALSANRASFHCLSAVLPGKRKAVPLQGRLINGITGHKMSAKKRQCKAAEIDSANANPSENSLNYFLMQIKLVK